MLCSAFPLESGAAYVSSCHRLPVFPRGLAAALGTPAGPEMLYGEGPGTQHKPSPEGVLANGPWKKDSSTSSCHPLCSHCMFYINEEAKKPHGCLNIQIKITCKRFIIMLTFFPFFSVFFPV